MINDNWSFWGSSQVFIEFSPWDLLNTSLFRVWWVPNFLGNPWFPPIFPSSSLPNQHHTPPPRISPVPSVPHYHNCIYIKKYKHVEKKAINENTELQRKSLKVAENNLRTGIDTYITKIDIANSCRCMIVAKRKRKCKRQIAITLLK